MAWKYRTNHKPPYKLFAIFNNLFAKLNTILYILVGDMLLKMEFTFDEEDGEAKSMGMNAKLHHLKTQNEQITTFSDKNPLGYAGQDFSVVIKAERIQVFMDIDGKNQTVEVNQLNIVLNSGISYTFPEKPNVKMPPSWAVNWLIVKKYNLKLLLIYIRDRQGVGTSVHVLA
jgi:hypothetical protein